MARKGKFGKKPSTKEDNKKANFDANRTPADKKLEGGSVKKGPGPANSHYAGLIFMCNGSTKMDCFKYRVLGLPEGKKNLVEQVRKGMRLFLFDVDLRLLYGIYTASSHGGFKWERDAFGGAFPWQVRFTIQKDCLPLSEDLFKAAIRENYMDNRKFKVELSAEQVQRLVKLFRPLPGGPVGSPSRPRMAVFDSFDAPPKRKAPRFLENDTHIQDRGTHQGYPPHRPKYEPNYTSDDLYIADRQTQGYLPPRSKYEPNYTSDDLYMADRQTQGYLPPRANYEPIYSTGDRHMADRHTQGYLPPRANHEPIHPSDDLYLAREAQLQRERAQLSQMSVNSLVPGHNPPLSLSLYDPDPLRPLSELQKTDPNQIRARDGLYSGYPQGHTLGNSIVEMDSLYRQRLQLPEVRGDLLDRRLVGPDSLVDSSLTYAGGMSSEILRGRSLNDINVAGHSVLPRNDFNTSFLHDRTTAVSGLSYRGEALPQSRHYVGGGW